MIRKIFSLILLGFLFHSGISQAEEGKNIKEKVYIHLSSNDLIVGETQYYSAMVYSQYTGKLSKLSSILYLELLDSEGKPVHQTKLKLENGRGFGDYFLPSLLATGNYQLVAYTRWMKNFNDYYNHPVTIINPYEELLKKSPQEDLNEILFYPEGGTMLNGVENRIVVKYTQNGLGHAKSGRIMSLDGEKIADFETSKAGLGEFNITPISGQKYQAIIDSKEGFEFYDLPEGCLECVSLNVEERNNDYLIKLKSSAAGGEKIGIFEVQGPQKLISKREVLLSSSVTILKENIPPGILKFILKDENGNIINERLIYNGKIEMDNTAENELTYQKREKVSFSFDIPVNAQLSVSVSKKYGESQQVPFGTLNDINMSIDVPQSSEFYTQANSKDFDRLFTISNWKYNIDDNIDSVKFLPEFRSDLIEGHIKSSDNSPVDRLMVGFAIPGRDYQIRFSESDYYGKFILNFDTPFEKKDGYISVYLDEENRYAIHLYNEFYDSYKPFKYPPLVFDSIRVANLIERSINNQIENAYYVAIDDSSSKATIPQILAFKTYRLDDYTRFRTIRDTFLEYIPEVGVSKNENRYKITVRGEDIAFGVEADYPTLLLLDGVPISVQDILEYSPYLVESISILNRKYFFGPVTVNGIVSFHTYKRDLENFTPKAKKILVQNIENSENSGASQKLGLHRDNRIPDSRELLYWNPKVVTSEENLNIEFFTSDVGGNFQIRIEGIMEDGKPLSLYKYFEVK